MSSSVFNSVSELIEKLASGELTSEALVQQYLDRIDALDGRLQAFVEVYREEALQQARAADLLRQAGSILGPLHGIPVGLKDLVDIKGYVTTGGSAAYKDRQATVTATLVHRLQQQGAIILGKTHTVEFATGGWGTNTQLGTPWNPWDLKVARTPGGSSSGSGVAVAAGLVPIALGTDTGGSVRLPASWCNLTGLKVSSGRISGYGLMPLSTTLDTPGPMARSAVDARIFYRALQGFDPLDPRGRLVPSGDNSRRLSEDLSGVRLARLPAAERALSSSEVLQAYDETLQTLAAAGADIVDIDLPFGFNEVAELNGLIMHSEGYSFYKELLDDPNAPLDEDVRPRLLQGRDVGAAEYLRAIRRREEMQQHFYSVFNKVDGILTPTTLTAPIPIDAVDQSTGPAYYTRFGNFFNLSAIALPNGKTAEGLPLSFQILGKPYSEEMLLALGERYQARTQWHLRIPEGL